MKIFKHLNGKIGKDDYGLVFRTGDKLFREFCKQHNFLEYLEQEVRKELSSQFFLSFGCEDKIKNLSFVDGEMLVKFEYFYDHPRQEGGSRNHSRVYDSKFVHKLIKEYTKKTK
jgi:hypothetical protein